MSHRYEKKPPKGCDPYGKSDEPRLPHNPFPWPRAEELPRFPEIPISVFLVLRGAIPDDGSRPISSLGGGSPDIQIDGPTTILFTLTSIAHVVPAPGSEQRIAARIWNFGDNSAVVARVRFWEVQGSSPQPELIGTAFTGVPHRSSISVQCPEVWRPSNASRVSVMVDVSDTINDPVTAPFDPFSDRHVAQKIIVSA